MDNASAVFPWVFINKGTRFAHLLRYRPLLLCLRP
jgi:hypothetical protein